MRERFIILNLKGEYLGDSGEFYSNMEEMLILAKFFHNLDSAETYIRRYLTFNSIPLKVEKIFLKSLQ